MRKLVDGFPLRLMENNNFFLWVVRKKMKYNIEELPKINDDYSDSCQHIDKIDISNGQIVLHISKKDGSLIRRTYFFRKEVIGLKVEGYN